MTHFSVISFNCSNQCSYIWYPALCPLNIWDPGGQVYRVKPSQKVSFFILHCDAYFWANFIQKYYFEDSPKILSRSRNLGFSIEIEIWLWWCFYIGPPLPHHKGSSQNKFLVKVGNLAQPAWPPRLSLYAGIPKKEKKIMFILHFRLF